MSFVYPTVTIGANTYSTYGDEADADLYLAANITAAGWQALTEGDPLQGQALVSGVRWLDSAPWLGIKADPNQELQWPRADIPNLDPTSLPTGLVYACFELASNLIDDSDARVKLSQPLAKDYKAGPVGITYFRPLDVQILTPFPPAVMALVGQWLQGGYQGPIATGTRGKSELNRPYDFLHGI